MFKLITTICSGFQNNDHILLYFYTTYMLIHALLKLESVKGPNFQLTIVVYELLYF